MERAFSRILLAYDDAPASQVALDYACALARAGATLILAHAVNESALAVAATGDIGFSAIDPSRLIEAADDQGHAVLQAGVAACAARGVVAAGIFVRDAVAGGIVALGRKHEVDLIVLGTHGRSGVARVVLGSVAEGILRKSHVPVLAINGHARTLVGTSLFSRALLALDDSDPARSALALAVQLAADYGTHLILCAVIAPAHATDASARERLERAAATSEATTVVDDYVVVAGEPAPSIERTAMQRNCDLIVVGSHGRRGLDRLVLGSVAEAVIRKSALPVLVVPFNQHAT